MNTALATAPPILTIARCPLVPHKAPELGKYNGLAGRTEWYVAVEDDSVQGWAITGPNRTTPDKAIEAWNAAWRKP